LLFGLEKMKKKILQVSFGIHQAKMANKKYKTSSLNEVIQHLHGKFSEIPGNFGEPTSDCADQYLSTYEQPCEINKGPCAGVSLSVRYNLVTIRGPEGVNKITTVCIENCESNYYTYPDGKMTSQTTVTHKFTQGKYLEEIDKAISWVSNSDGK
jgi:hypothetical protein